ncbi:MAG TPA: PilZ domain-containing protein [Nitrospira sp.]|nr:PilZ domain-containing protein [Nitrospira sp.]
MTTRPTELAVHLASPRSLCHDQRDSLPLLLSHPLFLKASTPTPPNAEYQTSDGVGYNPSHHMATYPHTRTYVRFPFNSPLILGGESFVCEGLLHNLSLHGCSILSDRELALGSMARISLLLPDQPRALPVEMGRVIWAQGPECGLEFLELSLSTRLRLGRILRVALIDFLNAQKLRDGEQVLSSSPSFESIDLRS